MKHRIIFMCNYYRLLGLDLVVRDDHGNILDPLKTSTVSLFRQVSDYMVPIWTGNIFQSGIKFGKFLRDCKILEKWGNFSQFISDFLIEVYLSNGLYLLNSLKILKNGKEILEKPEKFLSPKMWEPWWL